MRALILEVCRSPHSFRVALWWCGAGDHGGGCGEALSFADSPISNLDGGDTTSANGNGEGMFLDFGVFPRESVLCLL